MSDGQTPRKEAEIQRLDDSSTSILSLEQTYKNGENKAGKSTTKRTIDQRSEKGHRVCTANDSPTVIQPWIVLDNTNEGPRICLE